MTGLHGSKMVAGKKKMSQVNRIPCAKHFETIHARIHLLCLGGRNGDERQLAVGGVPPARARI